MHSINFNVNASLVIKPHRSIENTSEIHTAGIDPIFRCSLSEGAGELALEEGPHLVEYLQKYSEANLMEFREFLDLFPEDL
jgi:hypothetical protein